MSIWLLNTFSANQIFSFKSYQFLFYKKFGRFVCNTFSDAEFHFKHLSPIPCLINIKFRIRNSKRRLGNSFIVESRSTPKIPRNETRWTLNICMRCRMGLLYTENRKYFTYLQPLWGGKGPEWMIHVQEKVKDTCCSGKNIHYKVFFMLLLFPLSKKQDISFAEDRPLTTLHFGLYFIG